MGKVIDFRDQNKTAPGALIISRPLEFRSAAWQTPHFVQMLKSLSGGLEKQRAAAPEPVRDRGLQIPPHYSLSGSLACTIRSLYRERANEARMRRIYYLAGLLDCMINQVSPLLRTDLLRGMYKKIRELKNELRVQWYGSLGQVLLPIDLQFYNEAEYRAALARSRSMKELYAAIREGTGEMLDILSLEYVFYRPSLGEAS
jgi:hypothetical protein